MRNTMATVLMMAMMEATACGGSSPLRPSPAAPDHAEPPSVLSLADAPAASAAGVDCTPAVSPSSGSQTAPADQTSRWTMSVTFPNAPEERRHECSWQLESADHDLVVYNRDSGTRSSATGMLSGDGTVEIVVPARDRPAGSVQIATLRMFRVTATGVDRPAYWNYVGYQWKTV